MLHLFSSGVRACTRTYLRPWMARRVFPEQHTEHHRVHMLARHLTGSEGFSDETIQLANGVKMPLCGFGTGIGAADGIANPPLCSPSVHCVDNA